MSESSELVRVAQGIDWVQPVGTELSDAADARTRRLIDGFLHSQGPPPERFAWVVLGSHARRELHCASDQDHALFWETAAAAKSSYAADLAQAVIGGLEDFGMRRCDGGYMADKWSYSLTDWVDILRERIAAPTPAAIVDTDVFLDFRALTTGLDVSVAVAELAAGGQSSRLLHGLATAANSFVPALGAFGRLPREQIDLKKSGLAPIVLIARLYGLRAGSAAIGTESRLADAAGLLGLDLAERLREAHATLSQMRICHQLGQIADRLPITDTVVTDSLDDAQQQQLRSAFRAIKSAQAATALAFRTDL